MKKTRKRYKQGSIYDRWALEIEAYENGAKVPVSIPQCWTCANWIKGNALHCQCYQSEERPKYVKFAKRECPSYHSAKPIGLDIKNDRESKLYGGLFGHCVGDALGVPVEFSSREERKQDPVQEMRAYGSYHQPFGTWSDDTSLTLGLIDAMNKGYSVRKVADNFVDFYEKGCFTPYGEVFDIGISTKYAILAIGYGKNPVDCGGTADTDNGNGSLMRILPIAFWGSRLSDRELIKMVEDISSITHGHQRSKLACIIYVEFAIQLISGKDKNEAFDDTIQFLKNNCYEAYAQEVQYFGRILEKDIIDLEEDDIKSTGYVVDTLEAVMWTFFHADSYRETILKAINLGGDTDTIAAIVGGIAGIYYGFYDIPKNWIECLAKKEELYRMFRSLLHILYFWNQSEFDR